MDLHQFDCTNIKRLYPIGLHISLLIVITGHIEEI